MAEELVEIDGNETWTPPEVKKKSVSPSSEWTPPEVIKKKGSTPVLDSGGDSTTTLEDTTSVSREAVTPEGTGLSESVAGKRTRKQQIQLLKPRVAEILSTPFYDNPENRKAFYNKISDRYTTEEMSELVDELEKEKPQALSFAVLDASRKLDEKATAITDAMKGVSPIPSLAYQSIKSPIEGVYHGVQKIGETKKIAKEEGVGEAALNVGAGTLQTVLSGASAMNPVIAAFTVGGKAVEQVPGGEQVTGTAMAPVETYLSQPIIEKYKKAGEKPPSWIENTGIVSDLLWNLILFKGTDVTIKKFKEGKATPEDVKAVTDKATIDDIKKATDQTISQPEQKVMTFSKQAQELMADIEKANEEAKPIIGKALEENEANLTAAQTELINEQVTKAHDIALEGKKQRLKKEANTVESDVAKQAINNEIKTITDQQAEPPPVVEEPIPVTNEKGKGETQTEGVLTPEGTTPAEPVSSGELPSEVINEPVNTTDNAIPERSTTEIPVEEPPGNSEAVVEGIPGSEKSSGVQKPKGTTRSKGSDTPASEKVGDEVRFIHAGSNRTGRIIGEADGKVEIEGTEGWNKGFKYKIDKSDILKEGETAKSRLEKSFNDKVDETAEKVKKKLKPKGAEGLNISKAGLGFDEVIDVAAKGIKTAYKAGTDIHKAIDDAIKYIKENWDDTWGKFDEAEVKKTFEEANAPAIDKKIAAEEIKGDIEKMEKDVFGSATTTPSFKRTIPGKIFGLLGKAQEKTTVKLSKKIGDGIDKAVEKGLVSKNKYIQKVAKALNAFARLGLTRDKIKATDELFGGIERAKAEAGEINDNLRNVVDNNKESLQRVHRVLDPELYSKKSFKEFSDDLKSEMGDEAFAELTDADIKELFDAREESISGAETPLTYADLTPAEQKLFDLIRQVNDVTHKINFVTGRISHQTYIANKGNYIGRAYDSFEIPTDASKEMRDAGKKIQSGIYKQRTEIDDWKLEHKITDPVYLTAKRIYQTYANKSVAEYATWVKENKPEFVSEVERKGFTKLGTGYGDLSNKFVADNVAQDLKGFFFTNQGTQAVYDAFKAYDKMPVRQFYKKLFTVFNPGTQLGNITGDNIFGFLVGVDPITLNKNLAWAVKESGDYGSTYRYLLDKGLLKSDLTKEDLTNSLKNYSDLVDAASNSKNPLLWMKEKAENIYSSMDDLYKMAAFRSLMEQGMTPERAIELTQAGFQNSKRIPKVYDFAAKTPVIGNPFARWGADLARIIKTAVTERPLQTIGFLGALQSIAYAGSQLSGESEIDRKIREERPGAPKIPLPFGMSVPLGVKVGNAELNVARLISPFFIYTGIEDDAATQAWMKFSPYPVDFVSKTTNPNGELAAFVGKNINDPLFNFIQTIPGINADFRGKPILDPNETAYKESTLTPQEKMVNSMRFLARAYIPYANETTSIYDAAMGQEDYFGRKKNVGQALLKLMGVKVEKFGEEQVIKALTNKVESSAYEFMENGKKINTVKKLLETQKIDEPKAIERLSVIMEQQAKLISKVQDNIEEAKQKMTQEQLDVVISEMKGLNSAVNNYEEVQQTLPK